MPPISSIRRAGLVQFLSGRRTNAVRRFVAIATVLVGAAGLFSVPSDGVTSRGTLVILVVSASTVPIGLLWYRGPWSGRWDVAFLVYADWGIIFVLLGYRSMFVAMPGVALMSLTSLFAAVMTTQRIARVHTTLTVGMLILFAVGAARQGCDGWLLASRTMVIAALLLVPIVIFVYLREVSRQLDRVQRDPATGLWNRIGLESVVMAAGHRSADATALICVSMAAVGRDDEPVKADRALADALVHDMVGVVTADVSEAGALARTATAELIYCQWETDLDVATSVVTQWERNFDGHRLTAADDHGIRCGAAVVVRSSAAEDVRDEEWAVQRALAAAELRRRNRSRSRQSRAAPPPPAAEAEAIGRRVRAVISAGGPAMVYQPIRQATDLKVVGYEALSRFADGTQLPSDWFADAWSVGLGPALEQAAVLAALRDARSIPDDVSVFVNTSAAALLATDLPVSLAYASVSTRIVVEITEHDAIDEYDTVRSVLAELRKNGVKIAVDDVGAAYAGLRQLIALEPDIVKLDAHVVRGIHDDPARRAAAEAITVFARRTGTCSLFEGIESQDDLAAARQLGVNLVQGNHLGEPAPLGALCR